MCIFTYRNRKQNIAFTASNGFNSGFYDMNRTNTSSGVYDVNKTASTLTSTSMASFSQLQALGPTYMANAETLMPSSMGLAVPGFREVPFNSFVVGKQLAHGGGGHIYIAQAVSSVTSEFGNELIVKIIGNSLEELPPSIMRAMIQEISILQLMSSNSHFPKFIGYCEQPVCILMKYYECGSLENYLKKPLQTSHKLSITKDISNAILALHNHHVAHCDLKPANVLLERADDGRLVAILTDFGIARITSEEILEAKNFNLVYLRGLSWRYAAPEVIHRFKGITIYNTPLILKAGDIYAFAVIIYELLNGMDPW
jgi:serine/threonine-protein kinase